MQLQLFINNKLVGSVPLDKEQCADPRYIVKKQQELEERHRTVLEQIEAVPIFKIEQELPTDFDHQQS